MKYINSIIATPFLLVLSLAANSSSLPSSPEAGVLCDQYICADKNGVSVPLTKKHLGGSAANAIESQGEFDVTEFTFANGVFCDTKEKLCHVDRYFDAQGKRSAIEPASTAQLFDRREEAGAMPDTKESK